MKRVLCFFLCFLIIFAFSSCKAESGYDKTNQTKVSLAIKEGTLTKEGVTLVIKNNTAEQGNYGYAFILEKQENGRWYIINDKQGFILLAVLLEPNSETEHKAVFEGPLSKGNYRLIKTFYFNSGAVTADTEFQIK